jgi:hypothetical protein
MSLHAYQTVFARMTLDPALCRRIRAEGEAALAGYELTPLEVRRLAAIARQPGMKVNCTLSRANRLAAISGLLPRTCELLQDQLRDLLDRFWGQHDMGSLQTLPAGLEFAAFLEREIAAGRVTHPLAAETLASEAAAAEALTARP